MRRPLVGLALVAFSVALVNVDTAADWMNDHRVGLAQLAAGVVVLFLIFGAFVIDRLGRPSRSRAVSPLSLPGVAPARDRGGRVRASRTLAGGSRRARSSFTAAPGRRPPNSRTGPWLRP